MTKEVTETLYGITKEILEIESQIIQSGGEISSNQEEIIIRLSEALTVKTDNIVGFVKSREDLIEAFDKRISELQEAKGKLSRGLDKFNDYVINCMKQRGMKEIKGELSVIKMRKPSVRVEITDQEKIPEEFINVQRKIITTVDKTKVKNALKNGDKISGAQLVEGKTSLKYVDGE